MTERFDRKWDLTQRLYDLGLKKPEVWELYRLIDWLMRLPRALEQAFKQRVFDYERSQAMPYVTGIERMAMKEGWQKGQITSLQAVIVEVLQARFGMVPDPVRKRPQQIQEASTLTRHLQQSALCADMKVFQQSMDGRTQVAAKDSKRGRSVRTRKSSQPY